MVWGEPIVPIMLFTRPTVVQMRGGQIAVSTVVDSCTFIILGFLEHKSYLSLFFCIYLLFQLRFEIIEVKFINFFLLFAKSYL